MKRYILTFLYIITLIGAPFAFAQTPPTTQAPITGEYTVLAPLPGTTKTANCTGSDCKADINSYLGGLFGLAIGIGAVIAMILLGYYGFQYAMSDSASVKMAYSAKLWEIVQGLLLLISAYAIIYTINPDLLAFNLEITSPKAFAPTPTATSTISGNTISTGRQMTNDQIAQSNAVRVSLQTEGINTYADPCTQGETRGCVNLNGLTEVAKDGLVALKQICGSDCSLRITGGTEGGHSLGGGHSRGISIDLTPQSGLNRYLGFPNPQEGNRVTKNINGRLVVFTYEALGGNSAGTSTGNHWHVDFL